MNARRRPRHDDGHDRPTLAARLMRLLGFAVLATALLAMAFRAPDRPLESLVARWAPPPSDFIELPLPGGATQFLHLRDEGPRGDSAPVVLLHGAASSLHTWEGWVNGLKATRRVITLDLPGAGLTGPSASGDYSDEGYDRFLQALLAHLGLTRVVLGGNSLGGSIAWQYAARHPAQVAALVLVDPSGLGGVEEINPSCLPIPDWSVLQALAGSFLPRPLVDRGVREAYGDPSRVTAAVVDRYFELMLREGNRAALARRAAQCRPGANAALLDQVQAPALILWGGQDRVLPPANAERFHQRLRQSRVQVFPTLGHVPQEEDPVSTVGPVLAFISRP